MLEACVASFRSVWAEAYAGTGQNQGQGWLTSTCCGRACASWRRWSSRSAAAPTRRFWPGSPTTNWATTRGRSPRCRLRWPPTSSSLRGVGREWSLRWETVQTDEMADAAYVANDVIAAPIARPPHGRGRVLDVCERDDATILLGVNVDDLGDHVPARRPRGAGRGLPTRRQRLHQGRRARRVAPVGASYLGQARRRMPRVASSVRNAGDHGRPRRGGKGRESAARPRFPRHPRASLRRNGTHRGSRRRPRHRRRQPRRGRGRRACGVPVLTPISKATSARTRWREDSDDQARFCPVKLPLRTPISSDHAVSPASSDDAQHTASRVGACRWRLRAGGDDESRRRTPRLRSRRAGRPLGEIVGATRLRPTLNRRVSRRARLAPNREVVGGRSDRSRARAELRANVASATSTLCYWHALIAVGFRRWRAISK